jgi:hypothetical protein
MRFHDGDGWTSRVRAAGAEWIDDFIAPWELSGPVRTVARDRGARRVAVPDAPATVSLTERITWSDRNENLIAAGLILLGAAFLSVIDFASSNALRVTWRTPWCLALGAYFAIRVLRRCVYVDRHRVGARGLRSSWSIDRSRIVACRAEPAAHGRNWEILLWTRSGRHVSATLADRGHNEAILRALFGSTQDAAPTSRFQASERHWRAGTFVVVSALVFGVGASVYDAGVRHEDRFNARSDRGVVVMAEVERYTLGESDGELKTAIVVMIAGDWGVQRAVITVPGRLIGSPDRLKVVYDPDDPSDIDAASRGRWEDELRDARDRRALGGLAAVAGAGLIAGSFACGEIDPRLRRRRGASPTLVTSGVPVRDGSAEARARSGREADRARQTEEAIARLPRSAPSRGPQRAAQFCPPPATGDQRRVNRVVLTAPPVVLGEVRIYNDSGRLVGLASGPSMSGSASWMHTGLYAVSDAQGRPHFDVSWTITDRVRAIVRGPDHEILGYVTTTHIQSPDARFIAALRPKWHEPYFDRVHEAVLVSNEHVIATVNIGRRWPGRQTWIHRICDMDRDRFVAIDYSDRCPASAQPLVVAFVLAQTAAAFHRRRTNAEDA